jgi:hypothetical protein
MASDEDFRAIFEWTVACGDHLESGITPSLSGRKVVRGARRTGIGLRAVHEVSFSADVKTDG